MGYFYCECGETVKKPKLAKHLATCRSQKVSCIQCLAEFWAHGGGWELHTRCISEAEKVEGTLYVHKESTNKGQQKQDAWLDNVRNRIEDPDAKIMPNIKALLEKLLDFSNIPRKQKPFGNFVKNSLRIWKDNEVNALWEVISAANAKPASVTAAVKPQSGAGNQDANGATAKADSEVVEAPPPKWSGWKRALDEELTEAGGELDWKLLRDRLVKRYRVSGEANGEEEETLGYKALVSIPKAYLSRDDEMVRTPADA
mmetsp:Transcript_50802/g.120712  ORF Transcript_50802/g.120712 Transcript_50802/m.120712 type:complete len:257 (-) Transcript_50802:42-812(-)